MLVPMERLIKALSRLPSVGRRSAERMTLGLIRNPGDMRRELILALEDVEKNIRCCSRCGAITLMQEDPCRLCTDPQRDGELLCIVEDAGDVLQLEKSGNFHGRYHVMGKLSPARGERITPEQMEQLKTRLVEEGITEIILALNTDVESDATATFITEAIADLSITITRLAFGIPAGSGIAYSDPISLARAIQGRNAVQHL